MVGEGDEIGWPKKEGILGHGEEWTDEQLNVKSKLSALNQLRGEHMALLYGDFIPLRVEKQIYAYIRSFFLVKCPRSFQQRQRNGLFKARFTGDETGGKLLFPIR